MVKDNTYKLLLKKKDLFGCVFLTLLSQLFITFYVYKMSKDTVVVAELHDILKKTIQANYAFVFGLFALSGLILLLIKRGNNFYLNYGLFSLLSASYGLLFAVIKAITNPDKSAVDTVQNAILVAISIFVFSFLFSIYLIYHKIYVLKYHNVLFGFLIMLLLFQVLNFVGVNVGDIISQEAYFYLFILLFVCFIIYDTQKLFFKKDTGNSKYDCIDGAVDFYLDFINIFNRIDDE